MESFAKLGLESSDIGDFDRVFFDTVNFQVKEFAIQSLDIKSVLDNQLL
jgi:hypothetical protein